MNTKCRAECADQVLEALIAIVADYREYRITVACDPDPLIIAAEAAIAAATRPARGVAYCAGCDNTFPLEELRKHDDGVFCANCRPFDEHDRYIPTGAQHAAVPGLKKRCEVAEAKLSRISNAVNTYHDMMNKRPGLYAESQLELCLAVERIMGIKFERMEAKE